MHRTDSKRFLSAASTVLLVVSGFLLSHVFVADAKERVLVRRDSKGHAWTYDGKTGEEHWPGMFKSCGGSYQSPVNIESSDADFNDDLDAIEFENYDEELEDAKITNNGHTVAVFPGPNDEPMTIEEGGMDDTYQFVQLHFHWGSDSKKGSEHTIDGKRFPLEMHLVHRNKKYKTMEAANKKEDGLAVLGVLFKLSDEDNEALEPIIDKLDDVRNKGMEAELEDFELMSLLPDDLMPYYRYRGSLTTPPCSESVTWTVFTDYAHVSEKQMQQFRNVLANEAGKAEEDLDDNYRSTQPLHSRIIEISPNEPHSSALSFAASPYTLLLTFVAYRLSSAVLPSRLL